GRQGEGGSDQGIEEDGPSPTRGGRQAGPERGETARRHAAEGGTPQADGRLTDGRAGPGRRRRGPQGGPAVAAPRGPAGLPMIFALDLRIPHSRRSRP